MLSKYQNENCIAVYNLRKQYSKDNTYAVDGITFDVKYGTVFGFLGPNGAGKTTTLKILTTLLTPSSGSIRIFGKDLVKNQSEIKKLIGVVSQNPSFEANLTVERALDLYGMLWGLRDKKMRKQKVNEILNAFYLESIRNVKNDDLSIGQRRRVQVAREFMHEMDLLFLDEPTVGLDPSARRLLLDYIKLHVKSGLTVFFTTHIMEEAEYLCDEIAIINQGKIIATDTPYGLKQKHGGARSADIKLRDDIALSAIELVQGITGGVAKVEAPSSDTIRFHAPNAQELLVKVIDVLSRNSIRIESATVNPPTLEDVFLSIIKNWK